MNKRVVTPWVRSGAVRLAPDDCRVFITLTWRRVPTDAREALRPGYKFQTVIENFVRSTDGRMYIA